jgi:DNA-binding transcriptional ArsR family regulator
MTSRDTASEQHETQPERELDLDSLKALAHPLRVRIFDALSTYGSSTASALAERLGESSGSTSYHLRQLEKHGFVHEVEGKGTARERWWERDSGSINFGSSGELDSAAGRDAAQIVYLASQTSQRTRLDEFVLHGAETLAPDWVEASLVANSTIQVTLEQARQLMDGWQRFYLEYIAEYRDQEGPEFMPFQINFTAFAVVDPASKNVGG